MLIMGLALFTFYSTHHIDIHIYACKVCSVNVLDIDIHIDK